MKTYLLLFLFVFCTVLFAQNNSLVSYWRFVGIDGLDYTDVSNISFEAELIPGSGDIQTQDSIGAEILYEDIGLGSSNSFITFDFANFANPWQPDDYIRVRIYDYGMFTYYGEVIIQCSFMSEAPIPGYGWDMEGFGDPFAAQPIALNSSYPSWRNINWENGVSGMTWRQNDGIPLNELIHKVNGICPNVDEIPFYGSTGYFFTYSLESYSIEPFYVHIDLEALGYYPGQVGCYIEDSGWTFFPETWDYENPQPLEWQWFWLTDSYGIIEIILPSSKSYKSGIEIIIAFSAGSDIPLGDTAGPENVNIEIGSESVNMTWDAVIWATSYKVYSCETPYGIFMEDYTGVFEGTSWTAPSSNDKKFYRIKAIR